MAGVPVLCIYGEGESDSICPGLPRSPEHTQIVLAEIGKGHHFSGEYAALADRSLAFARRLRPREPSRYITKACAEQYVGSAVTAARACCIMS
jgi:type IV secretory pathway VirJ component